MEEGKILLIGNETDILHCAYSSPISEGGKRYPSADHYAHSMILSQLGLDEVHILELLSTPSSSVPTRARELLQENMPAGHDMNSLAQYLITSRQSYTMAGLRLRAEQDKKFYQALMDTKDALLIVCDGLDRELGIGMGDEEFVAFTRRLRVNADQISQWMHDERLRPREIGQNQLGFFLMWLRYEIKEKGRAKWLSTNDVIAKGISTDQEDNSIEITVSDFVIALQGIFQPLSNYYAMNFEIKGDIYRSVEHYAYQRLFESLKLPRTFIMKIRTTVKPVDVAKVARKVLKSLNLETTELEHKLNRLDRWRQSAMKHKITKNELLQQLLLSTGHSILLETAAEGDPQWSCRTDEFDIQHLLTKRYVTPQLLIDWMCGRIALPFSVSYLGGNKTGLLLMELRTKFSADCTHRIPLVSPLTSNVLRNTVSNYVICFTPESVMHPFYACEIKTSPDSDPLPSPIHVVAQAAIKFFDIEKEDAKWIMEAIHGPECWTRLNFVILEHIMPPVDKIQQWYMTERQLALKYAMHLQFEQNPLLLRILLDTSDAFLVSCARFSSAEAELNVGMRERDLRLWLSNVCVDSKSLMDLCLRPMAFRPPYFGGNRLGIILMEIRREFILKGIFPQQLPELPITVDASLGSESPMENYVPHRIFDILNELNYTALWANAYLLMIKQDSENTDMWVKATSKKTAPSLISTDESKIMELYDELIDRLRGDRKDRANSAADNNDLSESSVYGVVQLLESQNAEVMRSVVMRLIANIRERTIDDEDVQRNITKKLKESGRLQEVRRALERTRDQFVKVKKNENTTAAAQQSASNLLGVADAPSKSSTSPLRTANNNGTAGHPAGEQTNADVSNDVGKIPSLLSDLIGSNTSTTSLSAALEKEFEKLFPHLNANSGFSGLNAALSAAAAAAAAATSSQRPTHPPQLYHHNSHLQQQQQPHHFRRMPMPGNNGHSAPPYRNFDGNRGGRGSGPYSGQRRRNGSPFRRAPMGSGGNAVHVPNNNNQQQHGQSLKFGQHQQPSVKDTKPVLPQPDQAPPKTPPVKKPKRVVDESELSEGEILSDEDED